MRKIKIFLGTLMLILLSACNYNLNQCIMIDKDDKVTTITEVLFDNFTVSQTEISDFKSQLDLFVDIKDYDVEETGTSISLVSKNKVSIEEIKYTSFTEENGIKLLKVKIPKLVTTYNSFTKEYTGASMNFQITFPKNYKIIEANSFLIETYQSSYFKDEAKRVIWQIPTNSLSKEIELWVKYTN